MRRNSNTMRNEKARKKTHKCHTGLSPSESLAHLLPHGPTREKREAAWERKVDAEGWHEAKTGVS